MSDSRMAATLGRVWSELASTLVTDLEQQFHGQAKYKKNQKRNWSKDRDSNACGWCAGKQHKREDCPAKDVTCQKCDRRGHNAKHA